MFSIFSLPFFLSWRFVCWPLVSPVPRLIMWSPLDARELGKGVCPAAVVEGVSRAKDGRKSGR